jgi:signal transduction histidine kinase
MSLRWFFLLAFVALAAIITFATWGFDQYAVRSVVSESTATFLVTGAAFLGFGLLVSVGVFFIILLRVIAQPIDELHQVLMAFAKDGRHVPVGISPHAPKEIRSLESSFFDFTTAVESAHARDADISRMKSDFISTAAHQIRTPLTGIRWALEALEKSGLTEDQKTLVQNAKDKSHELVSIISTLLDISSIESGKYKYDMKNVDMAAMVRDVTTDFAPMAAERKINLSYAVGSEAVAVADETRVKWIVNNLVENALHYTPAGGAVAVTVTHELSRVFIRVKDTGIGIKPEDRGNIFERFYRGENARAKENEGNGLGLYIARSIAKDHGGDLEFAANQSGPGTVFTLTLPSADPARGTLNA